MGKPTLVRNILNGQAVREELDCLECTGSGLQRVSDPETGHDWLECQACLGSGYNLLGMLVRNVLAYPQQTPSTEFNHNDRNAPNVGSECSMSTTAKSSVKEEKQASPKGHSLFQKILNVQKNIDTVPKRGFNAFHKYHYATEADILTVKETLNANGLVVLPTTLHQETGFKPDGKSWASVTLRFRVIDAETGEEISSEFTGYAEDNFDKAIYKATTGANKYFYLKFFGIATEDDPEREDAPQGAGHGNGQRQAGFSGGRVYASKPAATAKPARSVPSESKQADAKPERRPEALTQANRILALQKEHGLSNEEVLRYAEIESIKDLAEAGEVERLQNAYRKLAHHVRLQVV